MAVYIRQTFVQATGDASFCLESSLHTRAHPYTHTRTHIYMYTHTEILLEKRASLLICACFQNLCVLCVCLNRSMDFDNYADNEF